MTRHQRSLNHIFLPSCLHHLLVASSIPLFENRYSLAYFWSVYDYSIAVATTIVPCLHTVVAASYSDSCAYTSRPFQTEKAKSLLCVTKDKATWRIWVVKKNNLLLNGASCSLAVITLQLWMRKNYTIQ
jgi:hypothetical protein